MGLLDNMDPTTFGLLGAASAYAPSLQYSRLPQNPMAGLLAAAGGLGQGYMQGQQSQLIDQEAQQRQLANIMTMARYRDIAQRHPEWFPQGIGGAPSMGGGSPASSMPNPMQVAQANQPGQASDAGTGPNNTAGAGQVEQQLADRMKMAQNLNYGPNGITMGAPQQGAPPMPQGLPPTGQGNGGIAAPTNLTDASDLLFMHPELKDVVTKQFPGPTDALRALQAANIDPKSPQGQMLLAEAAKKAAGVEPINVRSGGYVFDRMTGKPIFYGAKIPDNMSMEQTPNGPMAVPVPGAYEGATRNANIAGQKEANVAANAAALATGGAVGGGPYYRGGGTQSVGGGFKVGSSLATNTPSPAAAPAAASGNAASPSAAGNGSAVPTDHDTAIPPATLQRKLPTGTDDYNNASKSWREYSDTLSEAIPQNAVARQRLVASADALRETQSAWSATKAADVAFALQRVGIYLPKETWGDPAAVQKVIKDNVTETLSELSAVNKRFAQSEFKALSEKGAASPDNDPSANYSIITKGVGRIDYLTNAYRDFSQGTHGGWQDPQDFVAHWSRLPQNTPQAHIARAEQEIAPLMGMKGGPTPAAPAPSSNLKQFSSPGDPNLKMLKSGTHFLDANGVERIKP